MFAYGIVRLEPSFPVLELILLMFWRLQLAKTTSLFLPLVPIPLFNVLIFARLRIYVGYFHFMFIK